MKRSFLEQLELMGGAKLAKEDIEAIMAGKGKTTADNTIATLTAERDEKIEVGYDAGRKLPSISVK